MKSLGTWSGKGSNARKLLVAEFCLCMLILFLAPLSKKHSGDDVHAWIRRWFGITGLFLMLGLAATAGDRVGRVAAASGAIVTTALLFNDGDVVTNLLAHISAPVPKIPQPAVGQTLPIPGVPDGTITNTGGGQGQQWIVGVGSNF